jgi:hypothetical protein
MMSFSPSGPCKCRPLELNQNLLLFRQTCRPTTPERPSLPFDTNKMAASNLGEDCAPPERSTRELNPAFLFTREACCRKHLQTQVRDCRLQIEDCRGFAISNLQSAISNLKSEGGAYGCRSRTFASTGHYAEPLHQCTESSVPRRGFDPLLSG